MNVEVFWGAKEHDPDYSCWQLNMPGRPIVELTLSLDGDSRLHYVASEVRKLYPEIDGSLIVFSPPRGWELFEPGEPG